MQLTTLHCIIRHLKGTLSRGLFFFQILLLLLLLLQIQIMMDVRTQDAQPLLGVFCWVEMQKANESF